MPASLPTALEDITVLRQGDLHGNGMVLELTTTAHQRIRAIGVPQGFHSTTGPTWVYLVDAGGLTLIDAGSGASKEELQEGLAQAGIALRDLERVIVTHGHPDHDGGVLDIAEESGAQVWAHEMYAHLLRQSPGEVRGRSNPLLSRLLPPFHEEHAGHERGQQPGWHRDEHQRRYAEMRRNLEVTRTVKEGDSLDGLVFLHTPGHSPDELCITMDGVVFTGDHVLPEITPHPTVKSPYPGTLEAEVGQQYPAEEQYGLAVYLKALMRIARLDPSVLVLPAHRLYNRGQFHLLTVKRASDIARHHQRRLKGITRKLEGREQTLEELTRAVFPSRKLTDGNFYSGATEVVSHLELLIDAGDVSVTPEEKLWWNETEGFRQLVASLAS